MHGRSTAVSGLVHWNESTKKSKRALASSIPIMYILHIAIYCTIVAEMSGRAILSMLSVFDYKRYQTQHHTPAYNFIQDS